MKITIGLDSDKSLDSNPQNTRTVYCNDFPFPIRNELGRTLYLRLKQLGIADSIYRSYDHEYPSYIKVHIYEARPQIEGVDYRHFAGGFQYPPLEECEGNYGVHTFRQSPYIPMRFQELHRLHVELTDYKNRPLDSNQGASTHVVVEITDTMSEEQFTVHCTSLHPTMFTTNTLNHFTCPLPTSMNLPGYEVALLNFVYPSMVEEIDYAVLKINNLKVICDLNKMISIRDLVDEVKRQINQSKYKHVIRLTIVDGGPDHGKVVLTRHRLLKNQAHITIEVSRSFRMACGQVSKAFEPREIKPGETIIFEGQPFIEQARGHPISILHCSIIEPNIIGGMQGQALQIVPFHRGFRADSTDLFYEPTELTYHPVVQRPFNTITFTLKNPQGERRNFKGRRPNDMMLATLVFRRIKRH